MIKAGKLVLCLLPLLVTIGCWDSKTIQHYIYISAIGIDFHEGLYTAYYQFSDLSAVAKSEGGKSSAEERDAIWLSQSSGETLNSAFFEMIKLSSQPILWSHINYIVLSEQALSNGLEPIIDGFSMQKDVRYTAHLYGTKSGMKELFSMPTKSNTTRQNSLLENPDLVAKQYSYFNPITFQNFMRIGQESFASFEIPVVRLRSNVWEYSLSNEKNNSYHMDGMFVMKQGRYQGYLNERNAEGTTWVNNNTVLHPLRIRKNGQTAAILNLRQRSQSKISVCPPEEKPCFSLSIKLSGKITEQLHAASESELIRLAEDQIKADILSTYRASVSKGADVFDAEEAYYRKYPSVWKKTFHDGIFRWKEDSLKEVNVDVKLTNRDDMRMHH